MLSPLTLLGRSSAVLAALAATGSFLSAQCGINPNYGTNLGLGDDAVSPPQYLGFTFPFGGAFYDSVCVSSNGFLYLHDSTGTQPAPTASRCCNGDVSSLLSSTNPMICPLWQDHNPNAGGTVNFNAVGPFALITWDNVPEYGQPVANTYQVALFPNGTIEIRYGSIANVNHVALIGWSPGNGATDPGNSDLSALPLVATQLTVYELFPLTKVDLSDTFITAIPTGGGWVVDTTPGCARAAQYGRGCPKPIEFYEYFTPSAFDLSNSALQFTALPSGAYSVTQCASGCFDNGFTNALPLTDDGLATNLGLGFTFPFPGGATTAIDVCANGFLWLISGSSSSGDYSPTVMEFLNLPPRLAPLWTDLNPAAGGAVYFDALPNKAMVTWFQVPAYGQSGSANTFQVQLFPNGDFIFAWQTALNNATSLGGDAGIVGFSRGNGVIDPGSIDFSTAVPFVTGTGIPLTLAAQPGTRPVIGSTFTVEASPVRSGTIGGSLIVGVSNPNLDLTFLGLNGCTLLASLDVTVPVVVATPLTQASLPIPNQSFLIGRSLNTQVVMIDPSLGGALPLYLSNGVQWTLGN